MILFFDTETTGLPKNWKAPLTDLHNWPRLVQLAYLVYDFDGNLIHSCNEIIKPEGFTIPVDASNVHGITTDIANQRGSIIEEVFELFSIHLKRAKVIVAHNMAYDEKIKRTYDWDHFIPQTACPFLAISLYNLIPSCKVCNFLKHASKKVGLNPHYDYSIDELLTFSIKADNLNYFETSDDFEIKRIIPPSKYSDKLKQQLDTIYLEQGYAESKQMLSFLMRKYKAHTRSTFKSFKNLVGLISSKQKQALFERMFSVYTDERYYKHMPYSKLLSDILYRKKTH